MKMSDGWGIGKVRTMDEYFRKKRIAQEAEKAAKESVKRIMSSLGKEGWDG